MQYLSVRMENSPELSPTAPLKITTLDGRSGHSAPQSIILHSIGERRLLPGNFIESPLRRLPVLHTAEQVMPANPVTLPPAASASYGYTSTTCFSRCSRTGCTRRTQVWAK